MRTIIVVAVALGVWWHAAAPVNAEAPPSVPLSPEELARDHARFKRAAEAGETRAFFPLGYSYLHGVGTAKNPAEGFRWLVKAAEHGDVRGSNLAARASLAGHGTRQDFSAARSWAERSAAQGNAEGEFLFYYAYRYDPVYSLVVKDAADRARYLALARRPVKERETEILAIERLYRSATKGYVEALPHLYAFYADQPGRENRRRALAVFDRIQPAPPALAKTAQGIRELDRLGNSHATLKLFLETYPAALTFANAPGEANEGPACDAKDRRLSKIETLGPILAPDYLPLKIPELRDAYLVRGEWQERWTYDFCGKAVPLDIVFRADGLGGAYYEIKPRRGNKPEK